MHFPLGRNVATVAPETGLHCRAEKGIDERSGDAADDRRAGDQLAPTDGQHEDSDSDRAEHGSDRSNQ